MGNSKAQFLSLVALVALALISVSQCNNQHHHSSEHRHPCCHHNHCIRVRYDSYTGGYDWYSGCCRHTGGSYGDDSICHSHPDGYYVVRGFCDFEYECYSRSNISSIAIANDKTHKVNQTEIAMES